MDGSLPQTRKHVIVWTNSVFGRDVSLLLSCSCRQLKWELMPLGGEQMMSSDSESPGGSDSLRAIGPSVVGYSLKHRADHMLSMHYSDSR